MNLDELSDLRKRALVFDFIPSSDVRAIIAEVDRLRAVEEAATCHDEIARGHHFSRKLAEHVREMSAVRFEQNLELDDGSVYIVTAEKQGAQA